MSKSIEIIKLYDDLMFKVVPLKKNRVWMDKTDDNAYRCIPLNVANTYGWMVLSPVDFSAEWNGNNDKNDIRVDIDENYDRKLVSSEFGHGILSIVPDFIIKTPPGFSTYVRGVPNQISKNLQPFDAVVETDWLPFTFTFNFKFTAPGKLSIKKDQPLFTFFPVERGFIESFDTVVSNIKDNKELLKDYKEYNDLRDMQSSGNKDNVKGTYSRGFLGDKKFDIINHQRTTILSEFE